MFHLLVTKAIGISKSMILWNQTLQEIQGHCANYVIWPKFDFPQNISSSFWLFFFLRFQIVHPLSSPWDFIIDSQCLLPFPCMSLPTQTDDSFVSSLERNYLLEISRQEVYKWLCQVSCVIRWPILFYFTKSQFLYLWIMNYIPYQMRQCIGKWKG